MAKSISLLGRDQIGKEETKRPAMVRTRRQTIAVAAVRPLRIQRRRQTVCVSTQTEEVVWCICRERDDGREMIACDHDQCLIGWFHTDCVHIVVVPTGNWYCPNCSILYYRFK